MNSVTVQLSDREIEALKARTGKRSAAAALKAWAARANAKRCVAELRAGQRSRGHWLARELIILPRFKRDYRLSCAGPQI
jgi:hypothetical protein